ncbi:Gentisate 1,2-dioxygenase [Nocardia farcinica]|nr:Gentisate 1,2-dioxygenase [Nocardia farcinica]PFX05936.1 Gentisate 1,2-dioxygenase [Nocardia farcinica]
MNRGGFVPQAGWNWHAHHNATDQPMARVDGLDIPFQYVNETQFFEFGREEISDGERITPERCRSERLWGHPGLRPVGVGEPTPGTPLLAYKWENTDRALADQLAVEREAFGGTAEPGHAAVSYTYPATGRDVLPTIRAEFLPVVRGAETAPVRATGSSVYQVFDGSGTVTVGAYLANRAPDAPARAAIDPVEGPDFAPVVPSPAKVLCVGHYHTNHIKEMDRELPAYPTLFVKFADSLLGARDDITKPAETAALDREVELMVVICAEVRRAGEAEVGAAIAGFTIMNDISLQDWQFRTTVPGADTTGRPVDLSEVVVYVGPRCHFVHYGCVGESCSTRSLSSSRPRRAPARRTEALRTTGRSLRRHVHRRTGGNSAHVARQMVADVRP